MKARIALLLICAFLIALLVGGAYAKQPPKGLAVVCGTVTITYMDGTIGPAVGWNVWVIVPGPYGYQVAQCVTDSNGNYAMAVPASSGYVVAQEGRTGYDPDPLNFSGVRAYRIVRCDFNNYAL